MGRKPAPAAAPHSDSLNHEALQADSHALTVLGQRSSEIAERFGDGRPYELGRVVSEARFYMAAGAEAMFELGKRLIQIKENEQHGVFKQIVEEQLRIPYRTAARFMACTLRLSGPVAKAPTLALLGKSKLFELLDESDEDIEGLAEGGTIAGMSVDDMAGKSVREMRSILLEERKKSDAKDKLIAAKDKKLNALAEAEHIRLHGSRDEREVQQVADLAEAGNHAETGLMRLLATVDLVMREPASEAANLQARHTLDWVAQRFADLCAERHIAADLLGVRVEPGWLQAQKAVGEAVAPADAPRRAAKSKLA